MHPASVSVAALQSQDVATVKALIIDGLAERWGKCEASYNPDLESFTTFYQNSVVLVAKSGAAVVGVGILQPEGKESARIVRMSVSKELRRTGVGTRILAGLLAAASHQGFERLGLETTASWQSAVTFYKKHAFVPTHTHDENQYFVFAPSEA
jgi:GNAT superfamily N-acetyltransferase